MIHRYFSALVLVGLAIGVSYYNRNDPGQLVVLWGADMAVGPSPFAQAKFTETVVWGLAGFAAVLAWVNGLRARRLHIDDDDDDAPE